MDDLVERLRQRAIARLSLKKPTSVDRADAALDQEAAARITTLTAERDALKRQLEAKAKLTITDVRVGPPIYNPSTALETGEWKK